MPTLLTSRPLRVLLAALALVLTAAACDGVGNKAYLPNIAYPYAVFPITNAPTNVPTAINLLNGPTFANTNFVFDVAFDIDEAGVTRVYPVRALAGDLAGGLVKRVGMQKVTGSFESLREAPRTGYDTIGAQVVVAGSVLAVELLEVRECQFSLGGSFRYAKLAVDSIRPDGRRIFGRAVAGPNCGFRELMPDSIPER